MSKKNKNEAAHQQSSSISKRGWKVIGIGLCIVFLGFFLILFTDPAGQNWASNLCPFLLIGGYVTIGFGIMTKDFPSDSFSKNK
ncbi:MAG: hypothetical protein ACKVQC_08395 [Elusimicrobiota bacterium]